MPSSKLDRSAEKRPGDGLNEEKGRPEMCWFISLLQLLLDLIMINIFSMLLPMYMRDEATYR